MWTKRPYFTVELRKASKRAGKRPSMRETASPAMGHAKPKKTNQRVIPGPIAREVEKALRTNRFPRHWFN